MEEIYNVTSLAQEIKDAGQTYFDIISEKTTYRLENFPPTDTSVRKIDTFTFTDRYGDNPVTETILFSQIAQHRYFVDDTPTADNLKSNAYITPGGTYCMLIHNNSTSSLSIPPPTDAPGTDQLIIRLDNNTTTVPITSRKTSTSVVSQPPVAGGGDTLIIIPPTNRTNVHFMNTPPQENMKIRLGCSIGDITSTYSLFSFSVQMFDLSTLLSKTS